MSSFSQNVNFNQLLTNKGLRQDEELRINAFDAQTRRLAVLRGEGGGGEGGGKTAKPALGLSAAKLPTFSNMISPEVGKKPGVANPGSVPASMNQPWAADALSKPMWRPLNEGQPGSGTMGRTLFATDAAGGIRAPERYGYQSDGVGITPVKDDGLGTGSVFDDPVVRQGMRRGNTYVKDKTGRGNPKKDTVPAELAEGEAVLNAAAAEMLGRDEIERLNTEGAAAMGLRGGAKMKDGVMHAVTGVERIKAKDLRDALKQRPSVESLLNETPEQAYANNANSAARAEAEAAAATAKPAPTSAPAKVPTSTPPKVTLRGVGAAASGAATLGSYMASPEEDKVSALQGFGPMGAMVGLAGRAMQPLRDKLYAPAYVVGDKMMNNVKDNLGMSDQAAAPVAAPKPAEIPVMELAGAPSAYEQGMRAQVETRKGDNAEFSKFFNANGITDEMRANPAQAGLRRVNVPGSTDRIYQRGKNEFVGMGAPSRIAAEEARANDPAVQKAAQLKRLEELATQGNAEAGETLRQIIKADSDLAVEGLRGKAAIEAAGAKGSGKKGSGEDGGLKLAEQFKYAEGARGEEDQMSMLRGLDERKRGAATALLAEFNNPKTTPARKAELEQQWSQIEEGAYTQDNLAKTDLLLGAKQAGADNTATGMAAKYGILGGVGSGLGALYAARKGNFKLAKTLGATALGGVLSAAAGYKYGGGSEGIDENSDLYDIENMNLTSDGTKVTNGVQTMSFDSLPPQVQRLFLQKQLSRQQ